MKFPFSIVVLLACVAFPRIKTLAMKDNAMKYELKDEDYLKLWIYFEDRAASIKGAMFKTVTWTIGFAAALLGFIFAKLADFDRENASVTLALLVTITAIAGLIICAYTWLAISESAKHIQVNWDRAKECESQVKDFELILNPRKRKSQEGAIMIWNQLRIIVVLFALAFTAVIISSRYLHSSNVQQKSPITTNSNSQTTNVAGR